MDILMAILVFAVGIILLVATPYAPGITKFPVAVLGVVGTLVGAFFMFYIPITA